MYIQYSVKVHTYSLVEADDPYAISNLDRQKKRQGKAREAYVWKGSESTSSKCQYWWYAPAKRGKGNGEDEKALW
jgi:hypothetical protein